MLFPEQANLLLRCGCSSVESAFINAYQLSSEGGNKFLQILSPKRIFLYHLPFPDDDQYGYYQMRDRSIRNCPQGLPAPEIPPLMQWIDRINGLQ